jgi:GNAT superfamily N-acetyltransferase
MFDGPESPCTQTFGFGLFAPPSGADLDAIERFFDDRSAPVFHEVCPLAAPSHLGLLSTRGYRPVEMSNVMYAPIGPPAVVSGSNREPRPSAASGRAVSVRLAVADADRDAWARTLAAGWSDVIEVSALVGELARVLAARPGGHLFLAEIDGRFVAAGSLAIAGGVALLAGASTIPASRRQGAQSALLAARLAHAVQQGCDVAMVVAFPGSGSQRNAERNGFRVAYTRTKWQKMR